jgi:MFS family permease
MVIESWLNERSTNEARGRVFALYQVISLLALAVGQYLILVGHNTLSTPFIIAGALFSIGLVPVVLTRVPHPAPITRVTLDLRKLWRISPLGVAGTGIAALANGALFALGPVFARRVDLSTAEVAVFMSLVLLGGVALQWPIGHLSDRWDRRRVILAVSLGGAVLAGIGAALVGRSVPGMLAAVFLYGGAAFSLYPLCVAHSNDHVEPSEFVTTSSGLLLIYGIGAAIGPLLVGPLMQYVGAFTFLACLAAMHASLGLFVLIRMSVRPPPPVEAQEPFVMLGRTSQSALEMIAAADEVPEQEHPGP